MCNIVNTHKKDKLELCTLVYQINWGEHLICR